jgi:hypothetical protein
VPLTAPERIEWRTIDSHFPFSLQFTLHVHTPPFTFTTAQEERNEQKAEKRREAAALRAANPPPSYLDRMVKLQKAARGRFHRFKSRIKGFTRRPVIYRRHRDES